MARINFDFKPKSGPSFLIGGGIMFVLIGVLGKIDFLTFLGIIMMLGGVALSLHWADLMRRR